MPAKLNKAKVNIAHLHPQAREHLDLLKRELAETKRALIEAHEVLIDLGLDLLIGYSYTFQAWEDKFYLKGKQYPSHRYWITLRFGHYEKPEIRPIALNAFDRWEKSYRVEQPKSEAEPPTLIECWTVTWDEIIGPTPDSYSRAYHRLLLEFPRLANIGERLSPTCSINTVTHIQPEIVTTTVAVTCTKE